MTCVACWAARIERLRIDAVLRDKRVGGGTIRVGGQRTSLSAVLLRFKKKEYRIRYCLSSEKLRAVD